MRPDKKDVGRRLKYLRAVIIARIRSFFFFVNEYFYSLNKMSSVCPTSLVKMSIKNVCFLSFFDTYISMFPIQAMLAVHRMPKSGDEVSTFRVDNSKHNTVVTLTTTKATLSTTLEKKEDYTAL